MSTVKDWLEFEHKYQNKLRDFMSEEEEREFINDYSVCCENEGFNRVFWSPYEEQKEHIGKKFKVLRRLNEEECFFDAQPMWEIEMLGLLMIVKNKKIISVFFLKVGIGQCKIN